MFGFGNMFPHDMAARGNFKASYKAFSISMFPGPERSDVEKGGKIIMPPSALDQLTRLNIQYPMLFKLTSDKTNRETHCGVLEFVADEGKIYLPYWMMRNLMIDEGGILKLENVSLSVATFAKFQPQSCDFLDITNPKAVLENALRSFACLTQDDVIGINYNDHLYEMRVLETKPGNAVSIIECDMNVDFAPPIGYKEPEMPTHRQKEGDDEQADMAVDPSEYIDDRFRAFSGSGNRLDGKKKNTEASADTLQPHEIKRGIPNYDYKPGKLTFLRVARAQNGAASTVEDDKEDFAAFSGSGQCLRKKGTRK